MFVRVELVHVLGVELSANISTSSSSIHFDDRPLASTMAGWVCSRSYSRPQRGWGLPTSPEGGRLGGLVSPSEPEIGRGGGPDEAGQGGVLQSDLDIRD